MANVLKVSDPEVAAEIVESLTPRTLSRVLEHLEADEIADLVQKLSQDLRSKVLSALSEKDREKVTDILRYPPESAGGIMSTSIAVVNEDATAQEALQTLKKGKYDVRDVVAVINSNGRFVGLVPVDELLKVKPATPVKKLARRPRITANPYDDREDVAKAMLRYNVTRLPVVDENGRFLGIVPIEDIAAVLLDEAAEDIALLGGLEKPRERYLAASIIDLVKLRLPWLLMIYLIESVTATILRSYEDLIARVAVIAAFIPLIMDTGGNVGSQASSMIVRALALGEVSERSKRDFIYVVGKELATAGIIATIFALVGLGFAYMLSGNYRVAIAVAATLASVILFADLTGALLPMIARRAGIDPATLSSPLLTTIVDIAVVVVYMGLASALLSG